MVKNNSDTDNNVLTKIDNESNFPINFHPIPKQFMVWDTKTRSFCESKNNTNGVFDLIELATFIILHAETGRPHTDFVFIQSANLFDEDDEEIFDGSVIRDFDDKIGVVYYDMEEGGWWARATNEDAWSLVDASEMKVMGHILSNPELLERTR